MRGRYYKYKGKLAQLIMTDYNSDLPIKEIIKKYRISLGGLYGLVRRWEKGENHEVV
jgi:Mor family transcriptional regulator